MGLGMASKTDQASTNLVHVERRGGYKRDLNAYERNGRIEYRPGRAIVVDAARKRPRWNYCTPSGKLLQLSLATEIASNCSQMYGATRMRLSDFLVVRDMSIKVMNFIWDHYPEGGSELLLILALADHADDVGDRIYPSVQTMARKTRMSERTVQYLLRRIQERGWLVLVEAGGGRKRTARYRINMGRTGNGANIAPIAKGCNPKQERVQTSAETVQKNTVNGATAIAPEPPVEPSVTTTTTTPVVVVKR